MKKRDASDPVPQDGELPRQTELDHGALRPSSQVTTDVYDVYDRSSRWPRNPHRRLPSAKCLRSLSRPSHRGSLFDRNASYNIGFFDTVEYEAVAVRVGLVFLS